MGLKKAERMHSVAKRPLGYLILITPLLRSAAVKITFLFILRFPEFLIYRAECQEVAQ